MNNFIQTIVGSIVSIGFFIVLAVVAWYIALPLLLIALVVIAAGILRMRYLVYKTAKRVVEATEPVAEKRKRATTENIIDVEYTEV